MLQVPVSALPFEKLELRHKKWNVFTCNSSHIDVQIEAIFVLLQGLFQ